MKLKKTAQDPPILPTEYENPVIIDPNIIRPANINIPWQAAP